jgi:hypothetical protein
MEQPPWPQDKHPWFQGEPPWLQCKPSWLRLGLHDSIISISINTRAAAIVVGEPLGHYLSLWITEAHPRMCKTTLEPWRPSKEQYRSTLEPFRPTLDSSSLSNPHLDGSQWFQRLPFELILIPCEPPRF